MEARDILHCIYDRPPFVCGLWLKLALYDSFTAFDQYMRNVLVDDASERIRDYLKVADLPSSIHFQPCWSLPKREIGCLISFFSIRFPAHRPLDLWSPLSISNSISSSVDLAV